MAYLKNPIILALDVDSLSETMKILDQVGDLVGGIKLGPRMVYRYGAELIVKLSAKTSVFVDNKYFDIPSTMVAAVRASFEAGATLVTVHALSGSAALAELHKLETELNKIRPFKILAVTILTSWDSSAMPASLQKWPIDQHVKSLAQEVYSSGLRGLVCSGHELQFIREPDMFKVCPGIRLSSEKNPVEQEDQKRIMTPKQAITAGASALVIGRPIINSPNPRETVGEILESIK